MKRPLFLVLLLAVAATLYAQPDIKNRKYPSLLWEITGPGMKKPSYLIGTMHVSSKLAFNLPDSFYIALRSAQMVALETNPETWQDDMSKYDIGFGKLSYGYSSYISAPDEYFTLNTLKFYKYDSKIERSLYSSPSAINNLLYRSYGNESSDFEEDTYLDMYIYQCGKKWGKRVAGVEDYGESMKLMAEAYKDAAKDKERKERSYGDQDEDYSADKLQEAYRSGNLDLLDTINRYNSVSKAFDEKFLYRRNEIQAESIDSILRSGTSLFVGVGAAHLPGERGVIEILRKSGYKLRPVKMGERASKEKDMVDKLRVPVNFHTETATDGFYKVDIPGKFYKFGEDAALDQVQYADMANGSYYMVTRIMTNAWLWNHNNDQVMKKVDSLLYENIPGKIVSRTNIIKNGYKGIDLTNRTRRGDIQRYQIFITPFEVLVFKMSGNGDYVKEGTEAGKFFGSIQLKEYKNPNEPSATVKKFSPPYGGFSIDMPHEPYTGNDGSWIFDATDKAGTSFFRVIRSDIHNYSFAEEDTFDLALMDESFRASEFIDTILSRKQFNWKGYPALDCRYRDKDGQLFWTRFIIQGPHYFTLVAHGKQESPDMTRFFQSFELKPYIYTSSKQQVDTALFYSVNTPVFPEDKKIKLDMPRFSYFGSDDEEDGDDGQLLDGAYRSKIIANDTTGEKIFVTFSKTGRYYYNSDSSYLSGNRPVYYMGDSTWIVKLRKKTMTPDGLRIGEIIITDTGSSRTIWSKNFYKNGVGFTLTTQSDTLTGPSQFVKDFYESFKPADTLKGLSPYVKKSNLFFDDFMSADSTVHKRAVRSISEVKLDSNDLPQLKKLIGSINWKEKNYLQVKGSLINKLGDIRTPAAAACLKELYMALDDTIQLQYAALEALLQHKNAGAYQAFKEIINNEPPVLDFGRNSLSPGYRRQIISDDEDFKIDDGKFLDELSDSLQLTKTILPDLLPLLNLEDYKSSIMRLLGNMVDSNLLTPRDYEAYQPKFLIEAKQELKKQSIAEKKKAIEAAEESKKETKLPSIYNLPDDEDNGNDDLSLYATLLMPFWETHAAVPPLIGQMLKSNDKRLKYNTLLLLIDKKKPYPDSLLRYFASLDEYRYDLYANLRERKQMKLFPDQYNTHIEMARSFLIYTKSYNKPDSLLYVDRLPASYKNKNGFIYFFKYKEKKDDLNWKLATVGLVPENPKEFRFEDNIPVVNQRFRFSYLQDEAVLSRFDFTSYTGTKIKDTDSIQQLMQKELKKLLFSRRKSAEKFYSESYDRSEMIQGYVD